jgi:hypothetical protein
VKDLFGKDIDIPYRALTPAERKKLFRHAPKTSPLARASDLPGPEGATCKGCRHVYANGRFPKEVL